jgi:hypothetical protein
MSILRYFITSKAKRNLLKFFFNNDGAYYTREIARLTGEPLNAVRRELGYMEKAGMLHSRMQGNQKYYEIVKNFPLLAEWKKIILETDDSAAPARRPAVSTAPKAAPKPASITRTEEHTIHPSDEAPILPDAEVLMNHVPAIREEEPPAEPAELSLTAEEERPDEGQPALTMQDLVDYLKEQFANINSIVLATIHGDAAKSEEVPANGIDLLVVGDISEDHLLQIITDIEESTGVKINLTRMTRSDFDYRNAKGDTLIRRMWSEKKLVVKGRY